MRINKRKSEQPQPEESPMKTPKNLIQKLQRNSFNIPCSELAISLLGKLLVCKLGNGELLKGRIVETESYAGGEDKASYSYNGRRTTANEPMYMAPGTSFVYMTYGMYFCLNISGMEPGGAVLIRAVEPVMGLQTMMKHRISKLKSPKKLKDIEVCNGPAKLCIAMGINKEHFNAIDMCTDETFWVESDGDSDANKCVVEAARIGINSVGSEWAGKLLRFYIYGNAYVSKIDKKREELLNKTD